MTTEDPTEFVQKSDPALLAGMMDMDSDTERAWRPDELGAVLEHQLSAPVELDLSVMRPGFRKRLRTLASAQGLVLSSYRDLFHHPNPPVELLRLVKDFAKASKDDPESPFQPEIAAVLYLGSILVARWRCGAKISAVPDQMLREGAEWVLGQSWVDDGTKVLFRDGLTHLTG